MRRTWLRSEQAKENIATKLKNEVCEGMLQRTGQWTNNAKE